MSITVEGVVRLAQQSADLFSGPLEQQLNAADGKLGDGDTGVTLRRVFQRVAETATAGELADLGALFTACGRAAASATGSSLGTLCAVALMHAGKACAGQTQLEQSALAPLLTDIERVLLQRGQSALGDKTMLDGWHAAAQALREADGDIPSPMARAAQAAQDTLDAFRDQPCKIGRARMFAERSAGLDDPGMLAFTRLLQGLTN